jgi:hypothetical protein
MKRLGTLALTTMSLLLLEVVLLSCGLRRSFSEADRSSGAELPSGTEARAARSGRSRRV